jgi:hypothetical protein
MVISDEVKFPRLAKIESFRADKKVGTLEGPLPVARIEAFMREWGRRRGEGQPRTKFSSTDDETIKKMLDRVNTRLEEQRIPLHLLLINDADRGYLIDVYDCTGEDRCSIVRDIVIDPDDLPLLLRNLEEETGILVDTVS